MSGRRSPIPLLLACLITALSTTFLGAQEFSLSGGTLYGEETRDQTYSWQVGYAQRLKRLPVALAFTWLNEGHLPGHHRDGFAIQGLGLLRVGPGLLLGAGGGLYRSFDTVELAGGGHRNVHHTRGLATLVAQYPLDTLGYWRAQLQLTRNFGPEEPHTRILLMGVTYSFRAADAEQARRGRFLPRVEGCESLALMIGKTVLNSRTSELSEAILIEYRKNLSSHFDVGLSYSNEGDLDGFQRDGLAFEGWLSTTHLGGFLVLSVGAGPYVSRMQPGPGHGPSVRLGARMALAGIWRHLGSPWQTRVAWHRTRTTYDRDTDLILAGLGYSR